MTLSLDISQTTNPKTLRVFDTSNHTSDVENFLLECLPPNKTSWIVYKQSPRFSFTFNTSNLKLAKAGNTNELINLPDGIYEFRLSYKPNYSTVIHYYHLRTSLLLKDYKDQVTKLYSQKCDFTKSEFQDRKKQLLEIKFMMDAAKYMVEDCLDKEGKMLYEEAKNLLTKYSDACGC